MAGLENIFTSHVPDKALFSTIYQDSLQLKSKKTNNKTEK